MNENKFYPFPNYNNITIVVGKQEFRVDLSFLGQDGRFKPLTDCLKDKMALDFLKIIHRAYHLLSTDSNKPYSEDYGSFTFTMGTLSDEIYLLLYKESAAGNKGKIYPFSFYKTIDCESYENFTNIVKEAIDRYNELNPTLEHFEF